jgi:hypothetical protein
MSRSCWQKTPKPQHSCFRILSAETKKARSENGPFPFHGICVLLGQTYRFISCLS